MIEPNYALIRERCTYPPVLPGPAPVRQGRYEWKFDDDFGNGFGRFKVRVSPDADWQDVFGRDGHQSGFVTGSEFAICVQAVREIFTVYYCAPGVAPRVIYSQAERVMVRGLSADEKYLALEAAADGNALRPKVMIVGLDGSVVNELAGVNGTAGCWAGPWSPTPGDFRLLIHHEASGWLQPAIWNPATSVLQPIESNLSGEVRALWGKTNQTIFLHRTIDCYSDVHRFEPATAQLATVQPLDGVTFRLAVDEAGEPTGGWSVNHVHGNAWRGTQRIPNPLFQPSRPLHPMKFRRIAGVPCLTVGLGGASNGWTILDGYGGSAYHHTVAHNWRVNVLADHGFQVVFVNTRGCNGFGRVWREASLADIGFTEMDDMHRVREELVAQGLADGKRTILAGDSWGGFMALLGAGIQPELWRLIIAGAPVADWTRTYEEATPLEVSTNRVYFHGTPETQPGRFRRASPITYVDAIRSPIFMQSGTSDLLCPPKQNTAFVEAVRARGVECEFHLYTGGHGPPDLESRVQLHNRLIEFLTRHCAEH